MTIEELAQSVNDCVAGKQRLEALEIEYDRITRMLAAMILTHGGATDAEIWKACHRFEGKLSIGYGSDSLDVYEVSRDGFAKKLTANEIKERPKWTTGPAKP